MSDTAGGEAVIVAVQGLVMAALVTLSVVYITVCAVCQSSIVYRIWSVLHVARCTLLVMGGAAWKIVQAKRALGILTMIFTQFVRPSLLIKKRLPSSPGCRYFWGWLNAVFNRVDYERIKEVGPDRAASEWLLRCGAKVRYKGFDKWQHDYNGLPTGPLGKYKIQAIDANESCIMYRGFDYLDGLEHLEEIKLCKCMYIEDACLERISKIENLQKSLQRLEIITCGNVSDKGVISLNSLRNLQYLFLSDLPAIKQRAVTVGLLQKSNPSLQIELDLD